MKLIATFAAIALMSGCQPAVAQTAEQVEAARQILFDGYASTSPSGRFDGERNEYHESKLTIREGRSSGRFDVDTLADAIALPSAALVNQCRLLVTPSAAATDDAQSRALRTENDALKARLDAVRKAGGW